MSTDRIVKISIAAVVIGAMVYFCYSLLAGWYEDNIESAKTQERKVWQQKTEDLVEKIAVLEEELTEIKEQEPIPKEKLAEVFGEQKLAVSGKPKEAPQEITYAELERQIAAFFAYLDKKDYIKAYAFEGGTYNQYELAVNKLTAKRPIITGETDSLYNLFLNIAHFYRVLGKKRVFLVRDILKNESDILETAVKNFYLWYSFDAKTDGSLKGRPPLPVLYEYAGYLINTLGGRGYLMRRNSRVRIITTYYSVLLIDRANDKGLNSDGIDIRPHIQSVYNDIANQIGLIYQKEYLLQLEQLKIKYKMS
jgi:hypothetical protein